MKTRRKSNWKAFFCSLAIGSLFPSFGAFGFAETDQARMLEAEQILEKYFETIGGRDQFANAKGEYIAIEIRDPGRFELPFYFELCFSYEEPKGTTKATSNSFVNLRTFKDGKGWTSTKTPSQDGKLTEWDSDRVANALADWRGNFEVLTHRLASRDPDVHAITGEGPWDGWVEIYEKSEVVFRLRFSENGEPVQFHRPFDGTAVRFGPLVDFGGYRFPSSGAFEGTHNTFDFHIFRLINTPLTKAFDRPSDLNNPQLDCR